MSETQQICDGLKEPAHVSVISLQEPTSSTSAQATGQTAGAAEALRACADKLHTAVVKERGHDRNRGALPCHGRSAPARSLFLAHEGKEDNVFFEIVPIYTGEKLFLKKNFFFEHPGREGFGINFQRFFASRD